MRILLLSLALILTSMLLRGQAPFPSDAEIKQFDASKTCVVLEDQPFSSYNEFIEKAVKEYWKITPFEFISTRDFNVRRFDPAYSFIVLTQTNFDKDKSHGLYNFINLLQGKNVNKLAEMPEICAVPLSFAGEDDTVYSYKLPVILSFMQKHAGMISKDPSLTLRKYLKFYNKNIPDIKGKTILVEQEDLAPEVSTIEKIKAIYRSNIEIVANEDVIKAIDNRAANTVIVHKVGPMGDRRTGYCFIMLIGTDDSEMYYFNLRTIDKDNPNGLLASDLKQLGK